MTTKKGKITTFRQRLRAQAEERLDRIYDDFVGAFKKTTLGTTISAVDLAKLLVGGRTSTIRTRLITQIANDIEAELEEIYNNQQDLPLKEKPE